LSISPLAGDPELFVNEVAPATDVQEGYPTASNTSDRAAQGSDGFVEFVVTATASYRLAVYPADERSQLLEYTVMAALRNTTIQLRSGQAVRVNVPVGKERTFAVDVPKAYVDDPQGVLNLALTHFSGGYPCLLLFNVGFAVDVPKARRTRTTRTRR